MLIGIGTPSVAGMDLLSRIRWIESQGFEQVELYCCPSPRSLAGVWLRTMSAQERAAVRAALRPFRKVDFHAPFQNTFDLSLVSANPLLRRMTIEEIRMILEFASEFGEQSVVTCHSGWATFGETPEETETHLIESLQQLSELAVRAGVRIGMEVADWFMPADRFGLIEELDLPRVGITLDTGHISFVEDGRPMYENFGTIGGFIEHFGGLLFHVHIHDFDGRRDHLPIGNGSIDFERLFDSLGRIGYEGAVSLEMNSGFVTLDEIPESKRRLEALRAR